MIKPAVIAHCDWGKDPKKRYMAIGRLEGERYMLSPPVLVGTTAGLIQRLESYKISNGNTLISFDFPIGLPNAYAQRAGISNFKDAITNFPDEWFSVCDSEEQISLARPFYPHNSGGRKQEHLLNGLGISAIAELRRGCEWRTRDRKVNACPLFWTLGGNQVGKGAITGWREVVIPAISNGAALWPFDGPLANCLAHPVALAETYPADACARLNAVPTKKTDQKARWAVVPELRKWIASRLVAVSQGAEDCLQMAFGNDKAGEDRFDAFVGLLGMIDVVLGHQAEAPPLTDEERRIEGWILGQDERGDKR